MITKQQILSSYEKTRNQNQSQQELRYRQTINDYPNISALIKQKDAVLQTGKLSLFDHKKYQTFLKELKAIDKKIGEELVLSGLPKDYLDPIYSCKKCKDTGKVVSQNGLKSDCSCVMDKLFQDQTANNTGASFKDFNVNLYPTPTKEYMTKVLTYVEDYCKAFPNNATQNFIFSGNSGLGKTFLANCIKEEIQKNGYLVIKLNSYQFFDELKMQHIGEKKCDYDFLGCDLLIIDDLGTEPIYKNITVEYLFAILNTRIEKNKPTIIITNLNSQNIKERYGERVLSRVFDQNSFVQVMFEGNDIRLNK